MNDNFYQAHNKLFFEKKTAMNSEKILQQTVLKILLKVLAKKLVLRSMHQFEWLLV